MLDEITEEIVRDVKQKRIEFTAKVMEFAGQYKHMLHPRDYYLTDFQGSAYADLESYGFRKMEEFVPELAKSETRKIVRMLHEQAQEKPKPNKE